MLRHPKCATLEKEKKKGFRHEPILGKTKTAFVLDSFRKGIMMVLEGVFLCFRWVLDGVLMGYWNASRPSHFNTQNADSRK
jgi:hypothetical protein